jgi:hypothetical protein
MKEEQYPHAVDIGIGMFLRDHISFIICCSGIIGESTVPPIGMSSSKKIVVH